MTREEAKKRIEKLLRWYLKEEPMSETMYMREAVKMALEALSTEPTIPLSVIEKIKAELHALWDNEPCVTEHGCDKEVYDIIDKAVKECTHE